MSGPKAIMARPPYEYSDGVTHMHVYKSKSINSRVTIALRGKYLRERNESSLHRKSYYRSERKRKKIESVKRIFRNSSCFMKRETLLAHRHYFGFGIPTIEIKGDDVFVDVYKAMEVVGYDGGCRMLDDDGNLVFLLVPRSVMLDRWCVDISRHVEVRSEVRIILDICLFVWFFLILFLKTLRAMEESIRPASNAGRRGIFREPKAESEVLGGRSSFVTVGKYPERSGRGCQESNLPAAVKSRVENLVNFIYTVGAEYLPTEDIRAIDKIMLKTGKKGIFDSLHSIYPSISVGRNMVLPSHWDEDFFYGMTFVLADQQLSFDDVGLKHFVFPEYGVSVAMRNGDLLLFNPQVFHSVSMCTPYSRNKIVYSCSLYMKTKLISGNDNRQRWCDDLEQDYAYAVSCSM